MVDIWRIKFDSRSNIGDWLVILTAILNERERWQTVVISYFSSLAARQSVYTTVAAAGALP
jgi:putative Ca2+/H+ antiporter (TMEM165/GDT1 family)